MPSGGGGQSISQRELAPEQQQLLRLVIPEAARFLNNPPELFPDTAIADFSPLQQQAQEAAVGAATDFIAPFAESTAAAHQNLQSATIPTGTEGLGQIISGLPSARPAQDFLLSGAALSPESNPFLADTARAAIDPLRDEFTQTVLPSIGHEAANTGQFGSSRHGVAEGIATQGFQREVGNVASDVFSRGYSEGLAGMQDALRTTLGTGADASVGALEQGARSLFAAPQLTQLALTPSSILDAVGGQQRDLEQAFLTEEADRFQTEQIIPFLAAQDVANLAFGVGGGGTTTRSDDGGIDAIQAAIGGTAALASTVSALAAAGVFASDRSVKHNIVPAGKTPMGINLYVYSYLGSDIRHIGVMADDVPDYMTVNDGSGIMKVDYRLLA